MWAGASLDAAVRFLADCARIGPEIPPVNGWSRARRGDGAGRWCIVRPVRLFVTLLAVLLSALTACGTPPEPRSAPPERPRAAAVTPERDPCASGDPSADDATKLASFRGLLLGVRCRAELFAVMKKTATALGVACTHCHVAGNYAASTPQKSIANWMAGFERGLRQRGGGAVACADCHAYDGKPHTKMLGEPRSRTASVEWMTTVLAERFESASGEPLYCRSCHVGGLGEPSFARTVIGSEHVPLPPGPAPASIDRAPGAPDG